MIKKIAHFVIIIPLILFIYGLTPQTNILKNEKILHENNIVLSEAKAHNKDEIYTHEINNYLDHLHYIFNKKNIDSNLKNYKEIILNLASTHINNGNYLTANKILKFSTKYYKNDTQFLSLLDLNNKKIKEMDLVIYTGKIEHLNFHTLIAFPDKAFDVKNNYNCIYDQEKITTSEFQKILTELYKNNYILIDINSLFSFNNNKLEENKLLLPKNKKPLLLSFDNVSYKSNYQNQGEIDKIIIDRNNNIATYSTKKSIQDRINYDNEFIVILENFIKEHPDFSFDNARGIIFLTGENGILGYNTAHKNASNKQESKKVSQIIKKLKSLGWRFGCNNYKYYDTSTVEDLDFAKDLSLWNNEVKPIIGNTQFFAYPYGTYDKNNIVKQDLLISNGFNIFFYTDNNNPNFDLYNNLCFISRREINGETLRDNQNLLHLFNSEYVYDHSNRTIPFVK